MSSAGETGPVDHHLGESLAALIDGELSHDSRDRVLAHLATCPSCKAEADAQRELKSVFAASRLPAPSDALLARLQGLPGASGPRPSDASSEPSGPSGPAEPSSPEGGRPSVFSLSLLPGGRQRESLLGPPSVGGMRGFRIHETGAGRVHRGHRLAFAAAGAVSLAAFAIGGAVSSAGPGTATASSAAPSTVATGGGGATTVSAPRTMGGRPGEEPRQLPAALTAQAARLAVLSAPAGPAGPSSPLFPLLGTGLTLGPASAPGSAGSAGSSVLDAVSPP